MRRFIVFSALSLFIAGCTTPQVDWTAARNTVRQAGFSELALPSSGFGPGSLVTSVKGAGGLAPPLNLAYICSPNFTAAPEPMIDTAATAAVASAFNGGVRFEGAGLAGLGLGVSTTYVDAVTLRFSNVKVEQNSLEDLYTIRQQLGPRCKALLREYQQIGVAYQTIKALRADVEYQASFKSGASAEAKNFVLEALKSKFGGSIEVTGESSLSGQGLYYGLVLEQV
jgi:hypothetical protein